MKNRYKIIAISLLVSSINTQNNTLLQAMHKLSAQNDRETKQQREKKSDTCYSLAGKALTQTKLFSSPHAHIQSLLNDQTATLREISRLTHAYQQVLEHLLHGFQVQIEHYEVKASPSTLHGKESEHSKLMIQMTNKVNNHKPLITIRRKIRALMQKLQHCLHEIGRLIGVMLAQPQNDSIPQFVYEIRQKCLCDLQRQISALFALPKEENPIFLILSEIQVKSRYDMFLKQSFSDDMMKNFAETIQAQLNYLRALHGNLNRIFLA